MRRTKSFSTVDWRNYLDVNVSTRAAKFIQISGNDVLWQIATNIDNAIFNNKSELVLLVHPNAGAVIKITASEFEEVLNLSLNWFESNENYKNCAHIQKMLKNLNNKKHKESSKKMAGMLI